MSVTQQPGAVMDEEQRIRKLEKKEMERIAQRFKVITPAEFEKNLALVRENAKQPEGIKEMGNAGNSGDGQDMDANGADTKQTMGANGPANGNQTGAANGGAHLINSGK